MKKMFLMSPGKAAYPELYAYKEYFQGKYDVELASRLSGIGSDSDCIVWLIMGLYPSRLAADFIVHDYRSLSVGLLPRVKNYLKKKINQRPNLRVFLNRELSCQMAFCDGVPEVFIDMGVSPDILSYRDLTCGDYNYDFVYVGDVSRERRINILIEAFLAKYGCARRLLLVGRSDESIVNKYKDFDNIIFSGFVSRDEVYEYVVQSEYAVNFIPDAYPYGFQTSTKLLEYAALGKKIISSYTDSNRDVAIRYGIRVHFVDGYVFPDDGELGDIVDNSCLSVDEMFWDNIIKKSNVESYLP